MKLSDFGLKLSSQSAIVELMEDLGEAMNSDPDLIFLGGGNPANIPQVNACFHELIQKMHVNAVEAFGSYGVYSSPQGNAELLKNLAFYFKQQCGWNLDEKNIAIANGSQVASFILLNMFAGRSEGQWRKVGLPIVPEYMGYADQGISNDLFSAIKPKIHITGEHRFKYKIDFSQLDQLSNLGLLCLSRPTNPSGNVVAADDIKALSQFARDRHIPIVIDNAYGLPFPGIMDSAQKLQWTQESVCLLSTSKLGLPGLRCSIVVANEEIIRRFVRVNTTISLASNNTGQFLLRQLVESGWLHYLSESVIPNYYAAKRSFCLGVIDDKLKGLQYKIHEPEGAFFLWLWFEGLTVSSTEIYSRLKDQGVLVIDGKPFFFDVDSQWSHSYECIRLSYCQEESVIEKGIDCLAKLLRKLA